ncbi:MAG: MBL fold metallo-hydrolase [Nanoarchaeota archaeon]
MVEIEKLNHSGFIIRGKSKTIIIDPYNIKTTEKADIILITHPHFDHYSPRDIKRVKKKNSLVVMPSIQNNSNIGTKPTILRQWGEIRESDINIKAVPSYNTDKDFHPKVSGWFGYVIDIDNETIYHAGDTDLIKEMEKLGDITYAILPVGGKYTMNGKEAARAVDIIRPEIAIPMHYGKVIGGYEDADDFCELCSCPVEIK